MTLFEFLRTSQPTTEIAVEVHSKSRPDDERVYAGQVADFPFEHFDLLKHHIESFSADTTMHVFDNTSFYHGRIVVTID